MQKQVPAFLPQTDWPSFSCENNVNDFAFLIDLFVFESLIKTQQSSQ